MSQIPTFSFTYPFSERVNHVPQSFVRDILKAAAQPDIISFAGGLPNPHFFPVDEMARATEAVLKSDGKNALQYAVTEGYFPLRQYISDRYRHRQRLDIPPENILITNGSQQALDLIGKVFLDPQDPVLMERPSYLGAIQCLSMFQPHFMEANLEADGINLEELKEAYWDRAIKLFYCVPNYQNPTGICYSTQKRMEIAKIIRHHDTVLVEDDPYGEICFDHEQPDPIKSYNPEQTILLGSFSKTISPGLRLGWVAAETPIIEKLTRMKQASDLHSNHLAQRILHHFLMENDLVDHLIRLRNFYGRQKDRMTALIRRYFPANVSFVDPQGGMFIWLTLPEHVSAHEILYETLQQKVLFVPGDNFYVSNGQKNTIRLNFSNCSESQMEEGLKILGGVLKAYC